MKYFCKVRLEAGKNQETTLFLILNAADGEVPELSKAAVVESREYRLFTQGIRSKVMVAEYSVYRTETEITANLENERFERLIESGAAEIVSSGEMQIDRNEKRDRKTGEIVRKRKKSPVLFLAAAGGVMMFSMAAFAVGKNFGRGTALPDTSFESENVAEDGLIIPKQDEVADNAEQITVTIDRSYSAVPVEDLQLKGAVRKGKANILLPEFDKTDFFTHVPGYSWGFTSDPNGKKIEYYGGQAYDFTGDTKLYRVLVKYGGGSGTRDDPYRIDYFDQLELMSEEKARGYFRQTADISFPIWASHTPIRTVNELKADPDSEHFEYDGGGFLIENLNAPLFETVSGAVIKNVNIRNSSIVTETYKDYAFLVCTAYNYHYLAEDEKVYETGETIIEHCSVSHSSITVKLPEPEAEEEQPAITTMEVVPPDVIEYDEDGNIIEPKEEPVEPTKHAEHCIGAITRIGGQIDGCYVTDFGIFAKLPDYYLYCGGISGKPAAVTDSAVFYYSAQGTIFNAGGVVGSAAGARAYDAKGRELPNSYGGSIQGCLARNIILKTETAAGGIAAEGTTDAEGAVISNCYCNELDFSCGEFKDAERVECIKAGIVGGMIAADGSGKHGHLITNSVSHSDFKVIGQKSKSLFDETVRLAPAYAYYQENILTVLNKNTVNPVNPKEIYTGSFMFGKNGVFGDDQGSLAYPEKISDLLAKTIVEENEV
ncbi:MAG: hypothetical protein IKQ91_04700 [Oscillospiraceae bacterium]|nr:hypothetical protein [Oscillospiraceae bacterium]